jgi:hypothetical protein
MPHPTLRIFAYLALALACFTVADGAEAGVGAMSGGALSSSAHGSPVQTVQAGECWEQNGPDGPGYYPCGDGGGGGPIIGPAIRLHHRHGVLVAHPQAANPVYSGAPARRLGAGGAVPSPGLRGVGAPAYGAGGVHSAPGLHPGAAPVSPGLAGVHGLGEAAGAHVGAPALPGLTGGAGVHAPGSAAIPHISAPASPGVAGGIGAPHIGAPVTPNLAGVHAPGAAGVPHIGAPASPGLVGGGVHGVGGGGGIGHR